MDRERRPERSYRLKLNRARRELLKALGLAGLGFGLGMLAERAIAHPQIERYYLHKYSGVQPYSYMIFKEGDTYYAKNGKTGEVFEDDDAKEVIQSVFDQGAGRIEFIPAIYEISGTIYPRRTITVVGVSDYKEGADEPVGVVLKAMGDFPIFDVGGDGTYVENFKLFDLCLDGNDIASTLFKQSGGYRVHLISCELCRFTGYGIYQEAGGELQVHRCRINSSKKTQASYGIYAGSDSILKANIIRACKIGIRAGGGSIVEANHPYSFWFDMEIGIETIGSVNVINNYIDGYSVAGIKSIDGHGIIIKGNRFATKENLGTGDFPYILFDRTTAGDLWNVVVTGNRGAPRSGTTINKAIDKTANVDRIRGSVIEANSLGATEPGLLTRDKGSTSITGDGTATSFTVDVVHNLVNDNIAVGVGCKKPATYKYYLVDANADGFYETIRIEITFDTAPASGEEVPIYWSAEVVE